MAVGAGNHPLLPVAMLPGGAAPAPAPAPGLPALAPVVNQNQDGAGAASAVAVSNTGGWTVPTANATGAGWKAPDLARYDTQYGESIAATRAGIANQFQRALEDINAQEGIASQVVGTLPGRYNEIWGGAETQTQAGLGSLEGALNKSGLGGLMTSAQMYAPLQAGLAGGKAAFQATVPLTQLGTTELFTRQKGALAQGKLGAEGEVDKAVQDWIGRRMGIEADITTRENEFKQREAEREAERQRFNISAQGEESRFTRGQRSEESRHRASLRAQERSESRAAARESARDRSITPYQQAQMDLEREKMGAGRAEDAATRARETPVYSRNQVAAAKGELLERGDPAAVAAAGGHDAKWFRGQEGYKTLRTEFRKKYKSGIDSSDPNKVKEAREFLLEKSRGKPWDNDISILLYDEGINDADLGPAGMRGEKKKEKGLGKGGWGWWR